MGQPKHKPEKRDKRIVTLKVAPEKLQAIFPRPEPLSVFNPHAATPPSPIAHSSRHARLSYSFGSTSASLSLFARTRARARDRTRTRTSNRQTTSTLRPSSTVEQKPEVPHILPSNTAMAEKDSQKQPAASSAAAAPANGEGGVPFYESQRKHLQKLLEKKRKLTETLVSQPSPSTDS